MSISTLIKREQKTFKILLIIYSFLSIMFISSGFISYFLKISIERFTKDPPTIFCYNSFIGIFSYFGILSWCAAATICFFTSAVLFSKKEELLFKFFLYSGFFNLILLVDDLFLFHERIIPKFLFIPEKVTYLAYLIVFIAYLYKFSSIIIKTQYLILILASLLLGTSIIIDMLFSQVGYCSLIEDAFKLFGITTWAFFLIRTSYLKLKVEE